MTLYNFTVFIGEHMRVHRTRRQGELLEIFHVHRRFIRERRLYGAKGLSGVWKYTPHWKVTLCCARNKWCKHRDKPWFSWHPAAAEHGQNEQKNKCMVKTERQSMMQKRRMINTNQPEFKLTAINQSVQLSVYPLSAFSQYIIFTIFLQTKYDFIEMTFLERHEDKAWNGFKNGSKQPLWFYMN